MSQAHISMHTHPRTLTPTHRSLCSCLPSVLVLAVREGGTLVQLFLNDYHPDKRYAIMHVPVYTLYEYDNQCNAHCSVYIYIACFRNMIIQGHIVTHPVYHRHFHQELLNL